MSARTIVGIVNLTDMQYAIAIEPGDSRHAWGIVVPDLAGCFSAGDSLEQALNAAREAIVLHLEGLAADGLEIPVAQPVEVHRDKVEFDGCIWAQVEVETAQPVIHSN